jgi:hypothetical protein
MDDQMKDEAAVVDGDAQESDGAEESRDRYSTGFKRIDGAVHKIDDGVRWLSNEIHNGDAPDVDPERERHSSGIQQLDNVVHKVDDGVRRISAGLHRAMDAVKKQ